MNKPSPGHRPMLFITTRFLNPILRRFAGTARGPFALIRHVGRRSGKQYETPIIVQPVDDYFVIALTYGPTVDWYQNVMAAGRCTIRWHDQEYTIDKIEPLDADTALQVFPLVARVILRQRGTQHFIKLTPQTL